MPPSDMTTSEPLWREAVQEVLEGRRRWVVVHADCREVLPLLPDKSVQHVITDPPYSRDLYLRYRTNKSSLGLEFSENRLDLANEKIGAVEDVLDDVAPHMVSIAQRWTLVFHDAESGHLWREAFGALYVRTGVWVKTNPMPQMSGDRPGQGFELATIAHAKGRKRWNGGGRVAVWHHVHAQGPERPDHPCPKPLPLMLEILEDFTDPDEVILDPFAGSGTTGVAALRLGRRCILVEKDATYAALCHERMEAEEKGLSLKEARAGQLSLLVPP